MKRPFLTVVLLTPAFALASTDQRTVCTHDTQERVIEVVYPTGNQLPCEVRYTKNGNTEVLWNAENETRYCETKATEFIEKQRGWGWQCFTQ